MTDIESYCDAVELAYTIDRNASAAEVDAIELAILQAENIELENMDLSNFPVYLGKKQAW